MVRPSVVVVLASSLLCACSTRFTPSTYDRNQTGMTLAEVQALMGSHHYAQASRGPVEVYTWTQSPLITYRPKAISVTFKDGEVIGKSQVGWSKRTGPPCSNRTAQTSVAR